MKRIEKTLPTPGTTAGTPCSFRCRSNPEVVVRRDLPQSLEELRVGCDVRSLDGLQDDTRQAVRVAPDPRGGFVEIVERQHEGVLQDVFRRPARSRDRHEALPRLVPRGRVAHEEFIDASVEMAFELRDHRTLAVRPRYSDRMKRGLGPGHRETHPAVRPEDPEKAFRIGRFEFVGRAEHRGPRGLKAVADRLHHARVAVAQNERTEGEAVVDVLVAVEVPEAAALRLLHRNRVGIEIFHACGDAAREGTTRPVRIRAGSLRPRLEIGPRPALWPMWSTWAPV